MNKTTNKTVNLQNKKYGFGKTWGKLLKYSNRYMPLIIVGVLCAIVAVVFVILTPDKLSDLTGEIRIGLQGGINFNAVTTIGLLLVLFYSLNSLLTYVGDYIMAVVAQKVSKNMRTDISKKINRLPLKYFDKNTTGDTLSRVTNDVDMIGQSLSQSVANLIASAALSLGSLIMMFVTNWILALVSVGATIIGFSSMTFTIKRSQRYFVKQQECLGKLNGHIEESYSGHNVIKAYNAEKQMEEKFDKYNNELYNVSWKAQFLSSLMMPFMAFIGNFGYVAVCVAGAILTMNGMIDFEVIVAFMIYIRLFSQPLSQIGQSLATLQQTSAASYRVFEFLNEEELEDESEKSLKIKNVKGNIKFDHIQFGYDKDKTIIKDFSIEIKSGQKVAIVGPTGAGKTTIANLLMRFYELSGGNIYIDGVSTKDLKREDVHSMFCMVLQDAWLFEDTIKENVRYNSTNVTDEQIVEACKAVGVHHFIQTLPNGYDTVLNEEANISQGQKQLITIARAMVQNAPILILDEATSSVDTRTEILIQKAMDKLMVGRTSIVIAHRLSTIKNSDLILVIKDGDIVESGNHKELIKQNGYYKTLYNSQFED